ncbi:MAG TPA: DinB family protein [Terriglobales bacterium]|nr:DinB family protein [Terriglobales bacterium]
MHPDLAQALQAIDAATRDLTADQLSRHAEGKWSAAQILEHLSITFGSTERVLAKCVESGQCRATAPTLYHRVAAFLLTDIGYFPSGRAAPEFTRPQGIPPEKAMQQIRDNLAAMDAVLSRCEERFGLKVKIANHPVIGPLSVRQWRRFHLIHTRHHMKQIERLRSQ